VTFKQTEKEIKSILSTFHDDPIQGGHTVITRTLAKIKRHYYWKNMTRHIKEYIRRCHKCQMSKTTTHKKSPMNNRETPI